MIVIIKTFINNEDTDNIWADLNCMGFRTKDGDLIDLDPKIIARFLAILNAEDKLESFLKKNGL